MKRTWLLGVWLAGFVSAGAAPLEVPAPVHDFILPTFTKEGYRALLLRGREARFAEAGRIDLADMSLQVYGNDARNRVESLLTSPLASFFGDRQFAQGDQGVHLVRDDVDMSGTRWSYDHRQKKVVLDDHVRVIFRAQLKDILQ